jgi:hypothetical protein
MQGEHEYKGRRNAGRDMETAVTGGELRRELNGRVMLEVGDFISKVVN